MANDQVVEALSKMECASKLKSLDIGVCGVTDKGLISIAHACHNLEHLDVSNTSIGETGDDSVRMLSEYCPHLLSLNLVRTFITDAALQYLPNFKKLKNVNLINSTNLGEGNVTLQALANVIPKLPRTLEALGLDADDGCLKAIAQARMPLKHLFLSYSSTISNDGIDTLAKAQLPLETLSYYNQDLKKTFPYLERLPHLRCLITDSNELYDLDKYPKLFQACKNAYHQMNAQVHRESRFNTLLSQFWSAVSVPWSLQKDLYEKVALGTIVGKP